ncbi:MAG: AbrB/MazE/SpoVT family DNA-binding domain-containing protein [Burkholderiales bacterium]|uniref:AbrB/MazE/SpoVT family DNA-binding domain-containing protein n=1 Tax=Roseateles sp. TaxID=1971397 RepID=UPI000F9D61AF|nr:MAG: AbrB/MazE/SpoVT family DNA-binding domain-containing protein [Burkholderiales bacterium]
MSSVLVSAKGQVVLPADLRRRLGLNPGARLEVTEEPDGLRLRVQRAVPAATVEELAGMVTAPSRGKPRKLSGFDPASMIAKTRG